MKKLILSAVILFVLVSTDVKAQCTDSFFSYGTISANKKEYKLDSIIKSEINTNSNRAPLGSGMLILGGLALGYAILKKGE